MALAPYEQAVKGLTDMIKSVFDYFKTSKEHQAETEIIKDSKDKEKALEYAEQALQIADIINDFVLSLDFDDLTLHRIKKQLHDYEKAKSKFNKYKIT